MVALDLRTSEWEQLKYTLVLDVSSNVLFVFCLIPF